MKRVLFVLSVIVLSSGCVNNRLELPEQTDPEMIILFEWRC